MRKIIAMGLVALLAFSFGMGAAAHAMAQTQAKVVHLTLIDQNGSGQDGSAQITDQGDGTSKVELIMTNQPQGAEQPAGIHGGTCISPDPDVAFVLQPVKDLKSTSTIQTPLSTLLNSNYAIVVEKSASDNTITSCGIFPSAAVASGVALTMDQVMSELVTEATQLQGEIQKKEVDGSQNAYNAFHATFSAHENDIKAKSAPDRAEIDTAMTDVSNALGASNWDQATTAAATLVQKVKDAQGVLAGSSSSTGGSTDLMASLTNLEGPAGDLAAATGNKDKNGSTSAWNEFHTDFTAFEGNLQAKSPADQQEIETAMNEANDAIQAGDWTKAGTAAAELQQKVKEAEGAVGAGSVLPNGVAGNTFDTFLPIAIGVTAVVLVLLYVGAIMRRKAMR
jgi:hypothetical protein